MKKKVIMRLCRLCKQKLTYEHSTGVMKKHIQLRHLDVNLREKQASTDNTQQTSITTFASSTDRLCDADCSEEIMQLIFKMTVCDLLLLCFVEAIDFQKLMHYVAPEYMVTYRQSCTTVTSIIPVYQLFKCFSLTFVNCHVFFM